VTALLRRPAAAGSGVVHRITPESAGWRYVGSEVLDLLPGQDVYVHDAGLVPRGYHLVGAPHGFYLYYLNVIAGPVREWRFTVAPECGFLGW